MQTVMTQNKENLNIQPRFRLTNLNILGSREELAALPEGKLLINTINAHSYNVARRDSKFAEALTNGDVLIPDGMSIVKACRWLKAKSQPKERIAGWDLFSYEMSRLDEASRRAMETAGDSELSEELEYSEKSEPSDNSQSKKTVMFMGSSEHTLSLVRQECSRRYPHLRVVTYSPPYKPEFSAEDNRAIISAINAAAPDLLWIGMTAPKQEKWTYSHWDELDINCHVGTIGAVFDFFAGTVVRAPLWWQRHGLEWLYRLLKEPRRMWRRYIIGNTVFLWHIIGERLG